MAKTDPRVSVSDPHGQWGYVSTCWFTSTTVSPFHHSHRTSCSFPSLLLPAVTLSRSAETQTSGSRTNVWRRGSSRRIPDPEFQSSKITVRAMRRCVAMLPVSSNWNCQMGMDPNRELQNCPMVFEHHQLLWVPGLYILTHAQMLKVAKVF